MSDPKDWSRHELIEELQDRSDDGVAPLASEDPPFSKAVRDEFDSWTDGVHEAGLKTRQDARQKWSRETVLQELREKADGDYAPRSDAYSDLAHAARNYFDTWKSAVHAAGLKMKKEKVERWTKDRILKKIQEHADDGIAPRGKDVPKLKAAAKRHFDRWSDAVEKAGLKTYQEGQKKWTRDRLLEQLKQDAKDGIAPCSTVSYYGAARREFGDWEAACEAAGLTMRSELHDQEYGNHQTWNRRKVINQIQEDAEDGIAPSSKEVSYAQTANIYCGSWNKACEMAGVTPSDQAPVREKWTRERIIQALQEQSDEEGVAPPSYKSSFRKAVQRHFDSWQAACEAAGVNPRSQKPQKWTREHIIKQIKKHARDGKPPYAKNHKSLHQAARKYFDNWDEALKEAGFSDADIRRKNWSRKKVIRRIKEASEDGSIPSTKEHQKLYQAAKRHFDSWWDALREAGISVQDPDRTNWTEEKITQKLRTLAEDGKPPPANDHPSLYQACRKHFGSWNNAVKEAGLTPNLEYEN